MNRFMTKAIHAAALALIAGIILIAFVPYFGPGWAGGFDTLPHFLKVQQTVDLMRQFGGYVDWCDCWYLGYHQFLLYPPGGYLIPIIIQMFSGDLAATSKISTVGAAMVAAASTYYFIWVLTAKELRGERAGARLLAAAGAGAIFALSPAYLSFMLIQGQFPDFWVLAIAPLLLAQVHRWLEHGPLRGIPWGFAIVLVAIFLLHPDLAVLLGFGATIYTVVYIMQRRDTENLLRALALLFAGGGITLGLTVFWWLPYFIYKSDLGAYAPLRPAIPPAFLWMKEMHHFTFRYIGLFVGGLAVVAVVARSTRRTALPLAVLALTGIFIISGAPWSLGFPENDLLVAESGMPLALIGLGSLAGLGLMAIASGAWLLRLGPLRSFFADRIKMRGVVARTFAGLLLLVTLWDYGFYLGSENLRPQDHAPEVKEMAAFLKASAIEEGGRIVFYGRNNPLASFLPALTGKPVTAGYEPQASGLSQETVDLAQEIADQGRRTPLTNSWVRWNARWIVIEKAKSPVMTKTIRRMQNVALAFENHRFEVWRVMTPATLVHVRPAAVLLAGPRSAYVRGMIEGSSPKPLVSEVTVEEMEHMTPSQLAGYRTVILAGLKSDELKENEKSLRGYARNGGTVVVDPEPSAEDVRKQQSIKFLGFEARPTRFAGTQKATVPASAVRLLPASAVSADAAVSSGDAGLSAKAPIMAPSRWERASHWLSTAIVSPGQDGATKSLLVLAPGDPIVAERELGAGSVVMVGYNMFFHAAYHKSGSERAWLQALVEKSMYPSGSVNLKYDVLKIDPSETKVQVDASKRTWALISKAYSPAWRVTVDDKEALVRNAEGVLSVQVPKGVSNVDVKYSGLPWQQAGVALNALFVLVLAALYLRSKQQKIGRRTG